jgi:hypothetical protein
MLTRESNPFFFSTPPLVYQTDLLWLIHIIVCPEVDWLKPSQPDFRDAQARVLKHIQGMLDSLVGSAAWTVLPLPFILYSSAY